MRTVELYKIHVVINLYSLDYVLITHGVHILLKYTITVYYIEIIDV